MGLNLWRSHWQWPDIAGLSTFKGEKLHTAAWDDKTQVTGKRVGVIGNGSSGIQVVTAIHPGTLYLGGWAPQSRLTWSRSFRSRRVRKKPDLDSDHIRSGICRSRRSQLLLYVMPLSMLQASHVFQIRRSRKMSTERNQTSCETIEKPSKQT